MLFIVADLERPELRVPLMLGPVNAAVGENHQPDDDQKYSDNPNGLHLNAAALNQLKD